MNRPRRLLLLVPLALLGAALLVRARLPRPQTEGDKWLWEQAESGTSLTITRLPPRSYPRHIMESVIVTNRQGIRDLLRSFEKTPAFTPPNPKQRLLYSSPSTYLVLNQGKGRPHTIWLIKTSAGYQLYQVDTTLFAATTPSSVAHFQQMVSKVKAKAQQGQRGYNMHWMTF